MFDLGRSNIATTYPFVIKREYFAVQDARPLYHWPEKIISKTTHDNWEPQFKPAAPSRPKSAVIAAAAAPAEVDASAEGKGGEEDDDEEEDEEMEIEGEAEGGVEGLEQEAADEQIIEGGEGQQGDEGAADAGDTNVAAEENMISNSGKSNTAADNAQQETAK